MPPLEINPNWEYEDFDGPDIRSTPTNPNPLQYYIDNDGVLNIIPFSALVQNNSRVIDDRRRFKVPQQVVTKHKQIWNNIGKFNEPSKKSSNI